MTGGTNERPVKLATRAVEKPWGRADLPAPFANQNGRRIGEIWFEGPPERNLPLLVKYIFTSERLSIQVHPNDEQAVPHGLPSGKEECWYILDCEPGASLGIGLTNEVSEHDVRAAIDDGSIERLIDWKPIRAGDFFFIQAGTVHAIGAGITLVEIQQNADVTYRLYDYGRPRELHLADGLAVSRLAPYEHDSSHFELGSNETLLRHGTAPFDVAMVSWEPEKPIDLGEPALRWFIPLSGGGTIAGEPFSPGECWLLETVADAYGKSGGTALVASTSK